MPGSVRVGAGRGGGHGRPSGAASLPDAACTDATRGGAIVRAFRLTTEGTRSIGTPINRAGPGARRPAAGTGRQDVEAVAARADVGDRHDRMLTPRAEQAARSRREFVRGSRRHAT